MPTYASFDFYEGYPTYHTPQKRYLVRNDTGTAFEIMGDNGHISVCLWHGCAHLDGGNWIRHDRPDEPDPIAQALDLYAARLDGEGGTDAEFEALANARAALQGAST